MDIINQMQKLWLISPRLSVINLLSNCLLESNICLATIWHLHPSPVSWQLFETSLSPTTNNSNIQMLNKLSCSWQVLWNRYLCHTHSLLAGQKVVIIPDIEVELSSFSTTGMKTIRIHIQVPPPPYVTLELANTSSPLAACAKAPTLRLDTLI